MLINIQDEFGSNLFLKGTDRALQISTHNTHEKQKKIIEKMTEFCKR